MRPVRLELRGFTSFRESQVIDFEGLRLFAITGPTGAGKTSLLDAMTWALFGRVPRVGAATRQLIHQGSQVMSVRFDFTARGQTYRVSRQAPAPVGTRLERLDGPEQWAPVADRSTDVTAEVQRILGLDFDTFTKTVLLPQGQFDSFLRGEPKERRAVLSSLLGLEVYAHMRSTANSRATGLRGKIEGDEQRLEQMTFATPEAVAAVEAELHTLEAQAQRAEERRRRLAAVEEQGRDTKTLRLAAEGAAEAASTARAQLASARAALTEAEQAAAREQQQREQAAADLAALGYDETAHRALERQAERLELARIAREEAEAAAARLARAQEALARAQADQARAAGVEQAARAAAEQAHSALDAAATALAAGAAPARAAVQALAARVRECTSGAEAAEAAGRDAEQREAALRTLAERLTAAETEATAAAEAEVAAQRDLDTAHEGQQRAASEREAAEASLAAAREAHERARVQHAAADLRRSLSPGDPCPVCGEPISDLAEPHAVEDLDAARAAVVSADAALTERRATAERSAAAVASAEAALSARREAAERARAQATVALEALRAQGAEPGTLDEATARLRAERTASKERAASLRAEADVADAAERALGALLARLPEGAAGESDSEGIETDFDADALRARLAEALDAYASALRDDAERERALRDAETALETAATAVAHAEQQRADATEHVETAQRRATQAMAEAGGEEVDPAQVARDLAAQQQRAERARSLRRAVEQAELAIAAAAATLTGRREALDAAAAALVGAEQREAETRAVHEEAKRALDTAWREAENVDTPFEGATFVRVRDAVEADLAALQERLGGTRARLEQARREAEQAVALRERIAADRAAADRLSGMGTDLKADRFTAFVQREAMHLLAQDASEHLHRLSRERYRLVVEQDEFHVVDAFNGDERRSVRTLSGGETFLASLALALALSERLPELAGAGGAMSLEALFLDEGFGSLDAESLDVAIEGLELLSSGRRMIGVISHVPEIAERISDRIEVVKRVGTSVVRAPQPALALG